MIWIPFPCQKANFQIDVWIELLWQFTNTLSEALPLTPHLRWDLWRIFPHWLISFAIDVFYYECLSVNVVLCVNTYRGQKRELVGLFWLITLNFIPLSLLEPRTALTLRKPHWTPCLYQNSVEFMHRGAKGLNSGPNVYAASIFIHHSSTKLSISPLTTVNYESLLFFGILVLSIPGYKILGS